MISLRYILNISNIIFNEGSHSSQDKIGKVQSVPRSEPKLATATGAQTLLDLAICHIPVPMPMV